MEVRTPSIRCSCGGQLQAEQWINQIRQTYVFRVRCLNCKAESEAENWDQFKARSDAYAKLLV